jgi:hypothetical protein
MTRIENEPDVLGIGVGHHVVHFVLALELAAQMGMHAEGDALLFEAAPP